MYGPKFRLTLIIYVLGIFITLVQILFTFFFGEEGLDLKQYFQGVASVSSSALGGFILAWLSVKFLEHQRRFTRHDFAEIYQDDTGTGFSFPVSLSKYVPDQTAPPFDKSLHPLESELFGFLNGFRNWPGDVDAIHGPSLYKKSATRWHTVKNMPDTTHVHRIAALAQSIGKVYAYTEHRKPERLTRFWKQDSISFSRRCLEHGGLSAFILSTMPSFLKLSSKEQRALLTALRYQDDPQRMPINCDPLSHNIYETLHTANTAKNAAGEKDDSIIAPTDHEHELFTQELNSFFTSVVKDLELNPSEINAQSDGVYLGNGRMILRFSRFTEHLAPLLAPQVRTALHLWQLEARPHAAWPFLVEALRGMSVLNNEWEGTKSEEGWFNMNINQEPFPQSIYISLNKENYADLIKHLSSLPKWTGMIELNQDEECLLGEVQARVAEVDAMLLAINKNLN